MELEENVFVDNVAKDGGNNIFWTNRDDSELITEQCKNIELSDGQCITDPASYLAFGFEADENNLGTPDVKFNETDLFKTV